MRVGTVWAGSVRAGSVAPSWCRMNSGANMTESEAAVAWLLSELCKICIIPKGCEALGERIKSNAQTNHEIVMGGYLMYMKAG